MTRPLPLESLHAASYRQLQDVRLEPLRAVTLLVGRGATGKSALLEAAWLFTGRRLMRQNLQTALIQRTPGNSPNPLKRLAQDGHIVLAGNEYGAARTVTCQVWQEGGRHALTLDVQPSDSDPLPPLHHPAYFAGGDHTAAAAWILLEEPQQRQVLTHLEPLVPAIRRLDAALHTAEDGPFLQVTTRRGPGPLRDLGASAAAIVHLVVHLHTAQGGLLICDDFMDALDPYYAMPVWQTVRQLCGVLGTQLLCATRRTALAQAAGRAFEASTGDFQAFRLTGAAGRSPEVTPAGPQALAADPGPDA